MVYNASVTMETLSRLNIVRLFARFVYDETTPTGTETSEMRLLDELRIPGSIQDIDLEPGIRGTRVTRGTEGNGGRGLKRKRVVKIRGDTRCLEAVVTYERDALKDVKVTSVVNHRDPRVRDVLVAFEEHKVRQEAARKEMLARRDHERMMEIVNRYRRPLTDTIERIEDDLRRARGLEALMDRVARGEEQRMTSDGLSEMIAAVVRDS